MAEFHAGREVTFGAFTVNLDGIGTGRKRLPWSQLTQLEHQDKRYVNLNTGLSVWARVDLGDTPDVALLLAITDQLMTNARSAR